MYICKLIVCLLCMCAKATTLAYYKSNEREYPVRWDKIAWMAYFICIWKTNITNSRWSAKTMGVSSKVPGFVNNISGRFSPAHTHTNTSYRVEKSYENLNNLLRVENNRTPHNCSRKDFPMVGACVGFHTASHFQIVSANLTLTFSIWGNTDNLTVQQ